MELNIKNVIAVWIKTHSKVYGESISGISPSTQELAVPEIFSILISSGFTANEVMPYLGAITSPLAPKSSSQLKKLKTYSKKNDAAAKEALNAWCFAASARVTSCFNDTYFDGNNTLQIQQVYELMCRARGLTPKTQQKSRELTVAEVEAHLNEPGLDIVFDADTPQKHEESKAEVTYPRIDLSKIKNINNFPELEDVSDEALEFFGLKGVDKKKL